MSIFPSLGTPPTLVSVLAYSYLNSALARHWYPHEGTWR